MRRFDEFKSVGMQYKPKMRWWLPGAFVDTNELEKEISGMVKAGYGGAEILYFMGIPTTDVEPERYQEYYFGSKQWNDKIKVALSKAIELDFKLDFTIGPLWPVATPAIMDANDYRASWGLHIGTIDFENAFEGELPKASTIIEEKTAVFVGATIAKKVVNERSAYEFSTVIDVTQYIDTKRQKAAFSLSDLSNQGQDNATWTLFVYYAQNTGQMNDSSHSPVIDHLSKDATQSVIAYWENVIMGDEEIRTLYEKNGGDLFCDSLEINATMLGGMYDAPPLPAILWTPSFLEFFKKKRGYDLTQYLMCLFVEGLCQHTANRNLDISAKYEFEDKVINRQIRNDYYQTLTELINENHISPLKKWANSHNMKLRYQVYGIPTELTSSLHFVDVPESESLGFEDCIDSNLLLAGAVHMEKKSIYSYELGAVFGRAYEQMWTEKRGLLWQLHQAMAGGINQVILHGMSYNTESVIGPVEPIFKWPGLSLMATAFSNEWGNRQPIWEHSLIMTGYISRLQWLLRQGKPRVDVAIYRHEFDGVNYSMDTGVNLLSQAGYSYEYISPHLLDLGEDLVSSSKDGIVWDSEGASYKVLIVDYQVNRDNKLLQQPFLSLKDMKSFKKLAEKGLKIIWTIGEPLFCESYAKSYEISDMKQAYIDLLQYANVYSVEKDNLLQLLKDISVIPDRMVEKASNTIHVRRSCGKLDYYYIYNQSEMDTTTETLNLTGHGKPYLLNCWNGQIQEIEQFETIENRFKLQLALAPNEVITLVVGNLEGTFDPAIPNDGSYEEQELNGWELTVKKYLPGKHPTITEFVDISCGEVRLVPWNDIKGLENASGIGSYLKTIELKDKIKHCTLSLGVAFDTVKVIVNGRVFLPNQVTKEVEITKGLRQGENIIRIEVASTLSNALYGMGEKKAIQTYGLLGPVKLRCYL